MFKVFADGRHGLRQRAPQRQIYAQGGVGSVVADADTGNGALDAHALRLEFRGGVGLQAHGEHPRFVQPRFAQFALDRGVSNDVLIGESHPVGGQHAGQRMDEHPGHAERIGHLAGVLAARAAEALQSVVAHIVAAHDRNALHGVGHAAHRYLQRAARNLFGTDGITRGKRHALRQLAEAPCDDAGIQGFIGRRSEYARKEIRLDTAQQDVGVGDGQRACAPIARGSGTCSRGFRAYAQARAVEADDGPAAGRDAVNAHHGRANPHPAHFRVEGALVLPRKVAHVGGGAAHVEADELGVPGRLRGARHPDDPAGRARENRVLALEMMRAGQPARALHEKKRHAGHQAGDLIHIAPQDRRQIGVHHGGIAAGYQFHERTHAVRHRDLREADLPCDILRRALVPDVAVAV